MSRPTSLGRGLSALIPTDILDATDGQPSALRMVPLDQIKPNPQQPRTSFYGPALNDLAESLREHGIITPLLVRRDTQSGYVLIAGERRLRAAGLAGLEEVPVWVREDVGTQEQLELALVENIQREDLDPLETAEAYRRLIEDFGMTQEMVARRVGRDRATIANAVRLLRLPDEVLGELRAGRLTAGHAKALLALTDEAVLRDLTRQIITRELSVRATERLVAATVRPRRAKPKSSPRAHAYASDLLTRSLGTKVLVEPRARGTRGRIVIEYFTSEQLDRLVDRLAEAR